MGAGCYYTHKTVDSKAFWVNVEIEEEEELSSEFQYDYYYELIEEVLIKLGYEKYSNTEYVNGL